MSLLFAWHMHLDTCAPSPLQVCPAFTSCCHLCIEPAPPSLIEARLSPVPPEKLGTIIIQRQQEPLAQPIYRPAASQAPEPGLIKYL